jgi:replicative DNA helicase
VGEERPLVVVDYLQKVRVPGDHASEDERVTVVVEGLKDLALETELPVLAIVASDKAGLDGRTRLHHLRGSTALAYEADVALLLNDKFAVVARHHLMYGTTNAEHYKSWAVCSVEKNRSGRAGVELEFRKRFEHGHLDPAGGHVAEQLVDDRIHVDH